MKEMDELYVAAVDEVRGSATPKQKELLAADIDLWVDALERVIEEILSQINYRRSMMDDKIDFVSESQYEILVSEYFKANEKSRVFMKYISNRLTALKREYDIEELQFSTSYARELHHLALDLKEADDSNDDTSFESLLDELFSVIEAKS